MKTIIEQAWNDRTMLQDAAVQSTIRSVIDQLDAGQLRVAEKVDGNWVVHEWVKKAVIL